MIDIAELIPLARRDVLDDTIADYRWSDATLTNFALEAVQEACHRAPLLKKVSTVKVVIDKATYAIDDSIRQILVAKLDAIATPLQQTTDAQLMLRRSSQWRTHKGTPTHYVRVGHKITFYPAPILADTLVLSTTNNFNYTATDYETEVDIDPVYAKDLIQWIGHKAFAMMDADQLNDRKSKDCLAAFESAFGIRHTAKYDQVSFDSPMYGTRVSRY
jgi:hypothetical protein